MTGTSEPQPSPPALTWQLVHAEPGALVFAVPGVKPAPHPIVRHASRPPWAPSGATVRQRKPSKQSALVYAGYIGRVGLLAAALGVGASLAVPGLAWAEPNDTDSTTSTSSSSSESGEAEPKSPTESSPSAQTGSAPSSVVGDSGGEQSSKTDASMTAGAQTPKVGSETSVSVTAPGSDSPEAIVRSSGGAQTSTKPGTDEEKPAQQETKPEAGATVERPAAQTATEPDLRTQAEKPVVDTQAQDAAAAQAAESARRRHPAAPPAPETAPKPAAPQSSVQPGPPPARTPPPAQGIRSLAAAEVPEAPPRIVSSESASAAEAAPPESPQPTVVNQIVNAVLSPFSVPTAAPAVTAAQTPLLWGMFAWLRRTFFNQSANVPAPTAATLVDGAGAPPATQPDEALAFDVAGGPANGSVSLDPAGTFTYVSRADETPVAQAHPVQENFAVTVDDGNGGTTTMPVAMAVDETDTASVMSLAVTDPEHGGEQVNVTVTVTDPDTDPVTYLVVHDPSYGTPAPTLAAAEMMSAAAVTTPEYPGTTRVPVQIGTATFFIEYVTGPGNLNDTTTRFNIGGTDVGVMWDNGIEDDPSTPVNEHQVLIAFGDTFANAYPPRTGFWRINTLLRTPDDVLSNGLYVPNTAPGDIYSGSSTIGAADPKEIISRDDIAGYAIGQEVTIIPTAGISGVTANGTVRQYVNFMSVRSWDVPGQWTTNYSGIAYSDDNGQTWHVADSSIRPAAPGRSIKPFVQGNEHFQMGAFVKGVQVDENGVPLRDEDGKLLTDGYVYSYGTPSGRLGTLYLSRVVEADILDQTKYEYWNGTTWVANTPSAAVSILPGEKVSELSVQYNEYLNKYIVIYDDGANIVVRTAYEPQGAWSDKTVLVTTSQLPGKYAPMIHPWSGTSYVPESERKYLFWNVSTWDDYETRFMRTDLSQLTLAPTPPPGTPTPTPTPAPAPGGCGGAAALSVAFAAASVYFVSRLRSLHG